MSVIVVIKQWFKRKFNTWLTKQVPKSQQQVLSRRNIFIFPSKFGFSYLFFVLLLFILGTNYQNNLIILLSYLLVSVFITAMLQSFNNLLKLSISVKTQQLFGFADSPINIPVLLSTTKIRIAYQLFFQSTHITQLQDFSTDTMCLIPVVFKKRGLGFLPRLTVQSYYGFGLFRCWTSVDLNTSVLVYPKPEKPAQIDIEKFLSTNANDVSTDHLSEVLTTQNGVDEFNELIPYKSGESLGKVAWKHVARGQGWYSKNYDQLLDSTPNWLSLSALPQAPVEQQLRWLCYLIIELQKREKVFGLILPTNTISPDQGSLHHHICLKEIALYGQ